MTRSIPPDDAPPDDESDDPFRRARRGRDRRRSSRHDITINTDESRARKIYVNGVVVTIIAERVKYLDENGKLVTESLRDFTKRALKKRFASLDHFPEALEGRRSQAGHHRGTRERRAVASSRSPTRSGKDLDPFDLICHVAFDRPPLTRRERADNVRKRDVFTKYGPQARAVLEALLQKYQDQGVIDLGDPRILQIPPLDTMGTPVQLIKEFGTRADFESRYMNCSPPCTRWKPEDMSVRNTVKSIQDIMRQDAGVDGDAQRISQLCWMFFLKIIDDQDQQLELMQDGLPLAHPETVPVAHLGRRSRRHHRRRAARPSSTPSSSPSSRNSPPPERRRTAAASSATCSRTPTTT